MTDFAKTYGLALYELANEADVVLEIKEQLHSVCLIFAENPAIYKLLSVPDISKNEQTTVVDAALANKVHPYLVNFVKILVEHRGIYELENCYNEFVHQYNIDNNIEIVIAITSVPLSPVLFEKLHRKLEKITGKTIELTNKVDHFYVGGIVLEFESMQIDGSIQTKLDNLRTQMLSIMV